MPSNSRHDSRPLRLRRFALALLAFVGLASALEAGARALVPIESLPVFASSVRGATPDMAPGRFRFHGELLWELTPGVRSAVPDFWGDASTASGFRGTTEPATPRDPSVPRIVCVGDSCTYGLGLRAADAYPARLGAATGAEVVNAGVPGYSSWQGVRQVRSKIAALEPDVIVAQFGNNDCSPWPVRHRDGIRYLTDEERSRHLYFEDLARRSRFVTFLLAATVPQGVAGPVEGDRGTGAAPARVGVGAFEENLDEIARTAPVTVWVAWSRRRDLDPECRDPLRDRYLPYRDSILERRRRGEPVVDVREVFRRSREPASALYLDDVHATRLGSELVARAVRRVLADLARSAGSVSR